MAPPRRLGGLGSAARQRQPFCRQPRQPGPRCGRGRGSGGAADLQRPDLLLRPAVHAAAAAEGQQPLCQGQHPAADGRKAGSVEPHHRRPRPPLPPGPAAPRGGGGVSAHRPVSPPMRPVRAGGEGGDGQDRC